MPKPAVIYHASPDTNLRVLEPRSVKRPHDFTDRPVVWGTPSLCFATEFLVDCDDRLTVGGAFNETCYLIIGDKEKYLRQDHGGAVYVLPSASFQPFRGHEWYSRQPVTPQSKIVYPSGLEAMLETGVQVYFIDNPLVFAQFKAGADHLELIRRLHLPSENQRRGQNYIPL